MPKLLQTILTLYLLNSSVFSFFEEDPSDLVARMYDRQGETYMDVKNQILENNYLTQQLEEQLGGTAPFNAIRLEEIITDEDEFFMVKGILNPEEDPVEVSLKIREVTDQEYSGEQQKDWNTRNELHTLNECEKGINVEAILKEINFTSFNEILANGLFSVKNSFNQDVNLCVTVRLRSATLREYIETISAIDPLVDFTYVFKYLIDTLSVLENLNIITGDLREDNILVFSDNGVMIPYIDSMDLAKFVTFGEEQNIDPIIRYMGIYRDNKISELIIQNKFMRENVPIREHDELEAEQEIIDQMNANREERMSQMDNGNNMQAAQMIQTEDPMERVSVIMDTTDARNSVRDSVLDNGLLWDFIKYKYTSKEDNYAFGMLLSSLLANTMDTFRDSEVKTRLIELFEKYSAELTELNPMKRKNFDAVSANFQQNFWQYEVDEAIDAYITALNEDVDVKKDYSKDLKTIIDRHNNNPYVFEDEVAFHYNPPGSEFVAEQIALKNAQFNIWREQGVFAEDELNFFNFDD